MKKKLRKLINSLIQKKEKIQNEKKIKKYIKHSKYFDTKWYKNTYHIEKKSTLKPYKHYYEIGWKKDYNPSQKFDSKKYCFHNPDVKENKICPLLHYEKYGKKEGRKTFYISEQDDVTYKSYKFKRYIKRKISKIINYQKIQKNKEVKILVYVHIFYKESVKEIVEYLKNLESYNYELIISTVKGIHNDEIKKEIKKFKPNAKIYEYENRGFDVGPFLETISHINLDNYDIIFKLQSKGTAHKFSYTYGQIFKNRDWFEYLYEGILGAFTVHKTIDILYNEKNNIGIVAAKNLIVQDPAHKMEYTIQKLKQNNINIKKDYHFVAGTCYAEKANLVKKIQKLKIKINDFEKSSHGYFSFAHAMERFITANIEQEGYKLYGNNICKLKRKKYHKLEEKLSQISGIRLINDKKFILPNDFYLRTVENSFIAKYEICKIKLKDITRYDQGKYTSIKEWAPYQFLLGKEKDYIDYCLNYRRTDYMNLDDKKFEEYVKKNCINDYKVLIKKLEEKKYNKKYPIIIDENNNMILDGLHRASYLMYKYGENYKIKVLKIKFLSQDELKKILK